MKEPEVVEEPIVEEIIDNSPSEIAGFEHFLSKL